MPYCPKCGVEVDYKVKKCPLCEFQIPDIGENLNYTEKDNKFPKASNIYRNKIRETRNKIYYTITLLCCSSIIVLFCLHSFFLPYGNWINYSIISIISSWLYLFFLFGYVKNFNFSIVLMGIVTIFFTIILDSFNGKISWSLSYALPMIISLLIILILSAYLFKKNKHRNQFIFIPIYICTGLAFYSIILDIIISYNTLQKLNLSWSIIVFVILMSVSTILLSLYFKLPENIKEKLKRKFHI